MYVDFKIGAKSACFVVYLKKYVWFVRGFYIHLNHSWKEEQIIKEARQLHFALNSFYDYNIGMTLLLKSNKI